MALIARLSGIIVFACLNGMVGCRSQPEKSPAPTAILPTKALADAEPRGTGSPARPPETALTLTLEGQPLERSAGRPRARAVLRIPELGFEHPVAEVSDPFSCLLSAVTSRSWSVRCTPQFREERAHLERTREGLLMRWKADDGTAQTKYIVVSPERELRVSGSGLVSPGAFEGSPCEPKPASRGSQVTVTLEAVHDINNRNDLLYVGYGPGKSLQIVEHWAWKRCGATTEDETVVVACPAVEPKIGGRFWIETDVRGASVLRFQWIEEEIFFGAIVFPCGTNVRLRTPEGFAGGITNYG